MRTTYEKMKQEQRENDGVQELERVPVLFSESELNYIRINSIVMGLPFTTVLRIIVREHKLMSEVMV